MLRALWSYRGYIYGWVARDFRARYLGSVLGPLWTVLAPAAQVFIYMVVFTQIMKGRLGGIDDEMAFGLFLCTGIICWQYFLETLTRFQTVFFDNATLIKKMTFPRTVVPVTLVISSTINFLLMLGVFTVFLVVSGRMPGLAFFLIFPIAALLQLFAVGLGLLLGTLNIFFRDIGQFVGVITTFWFWATPIVYPVSILPDWAQEVIALNPLTPIFQSAQNIILFGQVPAVEQWGGIAVFSVGLVIVAYLVFKRLTPQILDEL